MKRFDRALSATGMRGFSLVELMIAIVLGLILVAAVGAIYLGSSRSYRTQTSVSQVQEQGRFANLLIAPIVRQAGYLPNPLTQTDPSLIFKSSNNKLAVFGFNQSVASTNIGSNYQGLASSSVVANTDVIAVAFEGKNDSSPADIKLKTCLGRPVDASQVAVNIFYISSDNGVNSLSCYDNITAEGDSTSSTTASTNAQPLVSGVTDMQILYGVDSNSDSNINTTQYMTAAQVDAAGKWAYVASVQITLTVDSLEATEKGVTATDVANGGRIRHTFNAVLNIRNRLRS